MTAPPDPNAILDALARHAGETPRRPAFRLVGPEGSILLDFGGLGERVARLGEALHAGGFGDGQRVALCIENRPAWPIAYLAAWYANAVTVPIDPALEAPAVRRILEHSEARVVMTSSSLGGKVREACAGLERPPLLLDVDGAGHRRWDGGPEGKGIEPLPPLAQARSWDDFTAAVAPAPPWSPRQPHEDLATIMYTSGTTGVPKGVMLSRAALAANIEAGLTRILVLGSDRILAVLPLFHVLPLMANCLGPVVKGALVVFLTELNPDRIIAAFRDHRITAFACVPLFYYRFHDRVMKRMAALPPLRRRVARILLRVSHAARRRGWSIGKRLFDAAHAPFGPDLRLLVTGGAKFDRSVMEDFLDLGFPLVQGYGLTEATAVLTANPLDRLRDDTVGPPVDGVQIRIVDADAEGIGEIQARTPSRMLGYYRNAEATSEAFDGEWLRTGDLGRVLPDGELQVTGRAKDVIVLASGKNIYPEELEAFYGRSPFIDEICILGIDDPQRRGAERLHAVVVPDLEHARDAGHVNVREMVTWELDGLGAQLPSPQRVTSLEIRADPLPRTTTRKIKRFELKREILERGKGAAARDRDATLREEPDAPAWATDLISLISERAGRERVSLRQHLDLDLGLESLDRVELQADIEAAFAVELPRERAAALQTVGDLVELVGSLLSGDAQMGDAAGDRWARVLAQPAPDIEPYLRHRPLAELAVRPTLALMRGLLRLGGYRVTGLEHLPTQAPYILAPNHFSFVDPFLLTVSLPRAVRSKVFFVGYSAYFRGRVLGYLGKVLRTVPIDQNRHLEGAMQAAAEGLRRALVLGIFPEGGRSADGTVKDFRRGAAILARQLQVPVVPVGLWGTYEMWPREGRPRMHPTAVAFGPPMRFDPAATREQEEAFMQQLRERVVGLVEQARRIAE